MILSFIAAFAFLIFAAVFAGDAIYGGLTGDPPLEVALISGLAVLFLGVSMLFGMLAFHDKR